MNWIKIKQLFEPKNNFDWMYSHAANPFAEKISDSIYNVYFTTRNINNVSSIGLCKLDITKLEIISISNKPILTAGDLGLFDDSGVAMGFLININQKKHLYYLGWNLKVTVPWLNTIGLAVSDQNEHGFKKFMNAPLLDRSHIDPFSISYPSVLFDQNKYKMWYGSNLSWGKNEKSMNHVIKYAESINGIDWDRKDIICINLKHKNEFAISKPFVRKENNLFEMWYSYRGNNNINTYRIGYAISNDGINWDRKDEEAGIDVSEFGWDSEMICYPYVFKHNNDTFMLYNGNHYGKTGFGIALLNE